MSAPLAGVLVDVRVKEGDEVEQGQVLAVIDDRVARAAVNAARAAADRSAEIEHARHGLKLAESLYARHLELQKADAGVDFELEQARVERDQAQATLASAIEAQLQARRNLELEEARLESHSVRAPFSGRVLHIEASVGTSLTSSDELLSIACLDALEAELHLPLELFGTLEAGKSYRLLAAEPVDRHVRGRLVLVDAVIDAPSRSFRCVFEIDNANRALPGGIAVRFDLSHPEPCEEGAQ